MGDSDDWAGFEQAPAVAAAPADAASAAQATSGGISGSKEDIGGGFDDFGDFGDFAVAEAPPGNAEHGPGSASDEWAAFEEADVGAGAQASVAGVGVSVPATEQPATGGGGGVQDDDWAGFEQAAPPPAPAVAAADPVASGLVEGDVTAALTGDGRLGSHGEPERTREMGAMVATQVSLIGEVDTGTFEGTGGEGDSDNDGDHAGNGDGVGEVAGRVSMQEGSAPAANSDATSAGRGGAETGGIEALAMDADAGGKPTAPASVATGAAAPAGVSMTQHEGATATNDPPEAATPVAPPSYDSLHAADAGLAGGVVPAGPVLGNVGATATTADHAGETGDGFGDFDAPADDNGDTFGEFNAPTSSNETHDDEFGDFAVGAQTIGETATPADTGTIGDAFGGFDVPVATADPSNDEFGNFRTSEAAAGTSAAADGPAAAAATVAATQPTIPTDSDVGDAAARTEEPDVQARTVSTGDASGDGVGDCCSPTTLSDGVSEAVGALPPFGDGGFGGSGAPVSGSDKPGQAAVKADSFGTRTDDGLGELDAPGTACAPESCGVDGADGADVGDSDAVVAPQTVSSAAPDSGKQDLAATPETNIGNGNADEVGGFAAPATTTDHGDNAGDDFGEFDAPATSGDGNDDGFGDFDATVPGKQKHAAATAGSSEDRSYDGFGDFSAPAAANAPELDDFGDFSTPVTARADGTTDDEFGDFDSPAPESASAPTSATEGLGDSGNVDEAAAAQARAGHPQSANDELGDFGDFNAPGSTGNGSEDGFGNFGSAEIVGAQSDAEFGTFGAPATAENSGGDDDFGDFDAPGSATASARDDAFGDFGVPATNAASTSSADDFGDFDAPSTLVNDGEFGNFDAPATAENSGGDDDFGDFDAPDSATPPAGDDASGDFGAPATNAASTGAADDFGDFDAPSTQVNDSEFGNFDAPTTAENSGGDDDFGDFDAPDSATASAGDDAFGDFGAPATNAASTSAADDFGDFDAPSSQANDGEFGDFGAPAAAESSGGDDDFGDFDAPDTSAPSAGDDAFGDFGAPATNTASASSADDFGDFDAPSTREADAPAGDGDEFGAFDTPGTTVLGDGAVPASDDPGRMSSRTVPEEADPIIFKNLASSAAKEAFVAALCPPPFGDAVPRQNKCPHSWVDLAQLVAASTKQPSVLGALSDCWVYQGIVAPPGLQTPVVTQAARAAFESLQPVRRRLRNIAAAGRQASLARHSTEDLYIGECKVGGGMTAEQHLRQAQKDWAVDGVSSALVGATEEAAGSAGTVTPAKTTPAPTAPFDFNDPFGAGAPPAPNASETDIDFDFFAGGAGGSSGGADGDTQVPMGGLDFLQPPAKAVESTPSSERRVSIGGSPGRVAEDGPRRRTSSVISAILDGQPDPSAAATGEMLSALGKLPDLAYILSTSLETPTMNR